MIVNYECLTGSVECLFQNVINTHIDTHRRIERKKKGCVRKSVSIRMPNAYFVNRKYRILFQLRNCILKNIYTIREILRKGKNKSVIL